VNVGGIGIGEELGVRRSVHGQRQYGARAAQK
jgi:hypothetical protein